jgi:hypothetical protein
MVLIMIVETLNSNFRHFNQTNVDMELKDAYFKWTKYAP